MKSRMTITTENWKEVADDLHWNSEVPVFFKAMLSNVLGRKSDQAAFWCAVLSQLMRCRHLDTLSKHGLTLETYEEQSRNLLEVIASGATSRPERPLVLASGSRSRGN